MNDELDPGAVATLLDLLDGDPAELADLVQTFLSSATSLRAELRDAVERQDWGAAGRVVHTLKSSSAVFGATALSSRCQLLEAAVASRLADDQLARLAADAIDACDRALARVAALAAERSPP